MYFVKALIATIVAAGLVFAAQEVRAHCDGLDGPVVGPAQEALETSDIKVVELAVKLEPGLHLPSSS